MAVLSVPFFMVGIDLVLAPKLFPQYERRVDWLADQMSLDRITSSGPEEAWGLVFLILGGGLLIWSLKELLFPREILGIDEQGVSFAGALGPAGGRIVVPHDEILEVLPAVLNEFGDESPAVGFRVEFPERLPSNPWGGVLVEDILFIRTKGLSTTPGDLAEMFAVPAEGAANADLGEGVPLVGLVVDLNQDEPILRQVEGDPSYRSDQTRAFEARSRIYVGSVVLLAGLLLAFFLLIADVSTNAWFLLPTALAVGGGVMALLAGRDYLESS